MVTLPPTLSLTASGLLSKLNIPGAHHTWIRSHLPDCFPNNGHCVNGMCICVGGWSGVACHLRETHQQCLTYGRSAWSTQRSAPTHGGKCGVPNPCFPLPSRSLAVFVPPATTHPGTHNPAITVIPFSPTISGHLVFNESPDGAAVGIRHSVLPLPILRVTDRHPPSPVLHA